MILIKSYNSEARDLVNAYMVNELTAEVNNSQDFVRLLRFVGLDRINVSELMNKEIYIYI